MLRFDPPIHPGEFLREEYLAPLGISPIALAKRLGVPRTRIERLVAEKTALTPDTALRLAKAFGTTPEFWLGFQTAYDVAIAEKELAAALAAIEPVEPPA